MTKKYKFEPTYHLLLINLKSIVYWIYFLPDCLQPGSLLPGCLLPCYIYITKVKCLLFKEYLKDLNAKNLSFLYLLYQYKFLTLNIGLIPYLHIAIQDGRGCIGLNLKKAIIHF